MGCVVAKRLPYVIVKASSWACGAVGSALPWHGRGREFESLQVHQTFRADRVSDPLTSATPGFRPTRNIVLVLTKPCVDISAPGPAEALENKYSPENKY